MGAILGAYGDKKEVVTPVFQTAAPNAAIRYSEPMYIVAVHYDKTTNEIRAVGEDANVRVCKVGRMDINEARKLWTRLQEAKASSTEIKFCAAGGFSPNKWFFDIQ